MSKPYRKLPAIVFHWLSTYPAYLSGSAATWYIDGAEADTPRDFDVFVTEAESFNQMMRSLPESAEIYRNTMGGVKIRLTKSTEITWEIDLWPQKLSTFFEQAKRKGYTDVRVITLDPYLELTSN